MATEKRRIQVPISKELSDALDSYSEVSGVPRATVLAGFCEEMIPAIEQLTKSTKLVKSSPSAAIRGMTKFAEKSVSNAEGEIDGLREVSKSSRKR